MHSKRNAVIPFRNCLPPPSLEQLKYASGILQTSPETLCSALESFSKSKESEWLTIAETSKRFKVHQRTIHRWIEIGRLKVVKLGRKSWRIPISSIDSLIQNGGIK